MSCLLCIFLAWNISRLRTDDNARTKSKLYVHERHMSLSNVTVKYFYSIVYIVYIV